MIKGIVFNVVMISFMFALVESLENDKPTAQGFATQLEQIEYNEIDSIDVLVHAMIQVESKGDDSAYCKREKAVGCLQIRPIMLREVNRVLSMSGSSIRYSSDDRWSREKSIEMFMVIYNRYHLEHSLERIARCWNGGPNGHMMKATLGYWNEVKKNM
jgi:hypothetical protein